MTTTAVTRTALATRTRSPAARSGHFDCLILKVDAEVEHLVFPPLLLLPCVNQPLGHDGQH